MRRLTLAVLIGLALLAGVRPAPAQVGTSNSRIVDRVTGAAAIVSSTPPTGGEVGLYIHCIGGCGGGGGGGGTSSTFGAAFPGTGTAAGFSDGTNMQGARVFDVDTGGGTQYVQGVSLRLSGSGGSVEGGTTANPLAIDLRTLAGAVFSATNYATVRITDGSGFIGPSTVDQDDDAVAAGQSSLNLMISLAYVYDGTDWSRAATNAGAATAQTPRVAVATSDPCSDPSRVHNQYVINSNSIGTFEIANADASNKYYICAIHFTVAAAQGIAFVEDDTDNCASPTAGLTGGTTAATGMQFPATGGEAHGNGTGHVFRQTTVNRYLCYLTSTTAQTSGTIHYVSAP